MATAKTTELTANQKRKAFRKADKLKNIIGDPFSPYWPKVKERELFGAALKTLKQSQEELGLQGIQRRRGGLILGLSQVVNKMNKGDLRAAVFSDNLEPKFVTRQLLTLALNKNPAIVLAIVPNLENLIDTVFGIKSYTFGISKCEDSDELSKFLATISSISSRTPPPARPVTKFESTADKDIQKTPSGLIKTCADLKDSVYLLRNGPKQSAWLPTPNLNDDTNQQGSSQNRAVKQWGDFISLHDNSINRVASDLNEDRNRLKSILFTTVEAPELKPSDLTSKESSNPEQLEGPTTSASITNVFSSGKPSIKCGTKKSLKRQLDPHFLPMKVQKVQKNPKKVKRSKKRKSN